MDEAVEFSLAYVFAFTYVADFFRKLGFEEVERGVLPLKVWKDCLRCPKFQSCDEIPMMRVLRAEEQLASTHKWGLSTTTDEANESILLPIICKQ